MGFAYNKLKGKIKEVYGTQEAFAIAMGMGRTTLHSKLHNITEFTQSEMLRALELLHLEKADIDIYFFYPESSESRTRAGVNGGANG